MEAPGTAVEAEVAAEPVAPCRPTAEDEAACPVEDVAAPSATLGVADLRRLLGEGWEIVEPEKLAAILTANPVLQGALAAREKQIREAFGLPVRLIIGPDWAETAVAIDFEGDFSAKEWMEGRERVLDAWLDRLPPEYDELIVL
jgi:hypothetical protein